MTIVSHRYRLIFLKPRKTAGTSIERALLRITAAEDWSATSTENEPVDARLFATPNRTRRAMPGERVVKRVLRRAGPRALGLREHMAADAVRRLVGEPTWSRYRKISTVRDPWARLVSLWRWRRRRDGIEIDFEHFLRAIESGTRAAQKVAGARRWSNLPFYAIDGALILDRAMRFESIADDFAAMLHEYDLPDPGPLEHMKTRPGAATDPAEVLTPDHVERIASLCRTEIEWFGYSPPIVSGQG